MIKNGLDKHGLDRFGFDRLLYSRKKGKIYKYWNDSGRNYKTNKMLDIEGYDRNGYDRDGYDKDGFFKDGYNKEGVNKEGLTREEQEDKNEKEKENKKNQQRKNYLGLKNKAEKLGKGEISLEDYIKCSKTSIDDLIIFAKKEEMSADVIRGLYKYKKPYDVYKKPFNKKEYLATQGYFINGQEVKPTEEDVDKCIEYLQVNGALICDKTVKDTVRQYLKGDLDINIKDTEQKENLIETILGQQAKIKAQEAEIIDLKNQNKGEI